LGEKIELLVIKDVAQSYLTGLWNKDVFKNKKRIILILISSVNTLRLPYLYFALVRQVIGLPKANIN